MSDVRKLLTGRRLLTQRSRNECSPSSIDVHKPDFIGLSSRQGSFYEARSDSNLLLAYVFDSHPKNAMNSLYAQLQERLLQLLPRALKSDTSIEGLGLIRRDVTLRDESCIYRPVIEVIVQGSIQSVIGNERLEYGEGQFMVAGVDTPCIIREVKAEPGSAFLAISLALDVALITELVAQTKLPGAPSDQSHKGICITPAMPEVGDAFLRLLRLLDSPQHLPALAPMIIREIHYYLLNGPLSDYLRALATQGTHSQRIAQSVAWLREHFLQPLVIEHLAEQAHMSPSTFHRHFRKVTSYSPLRFHKRLRLYEAQRLMLVKELDAAAAAFHVGYESASQFNREYKREFGEPPQRDIARMRIAEIVLD